MSAYKPRDVQSRWDAILTAVDGVTARVAAEVVQRSVSMVQRWTNPDEGKEPSLSQAVALDRAYVEKNGGPGPIHAWFGQQLAGLAAAHAPKKPEDRLIDATCEFGDIARKFQEAVRDGNLSPADAASVVKEVRDTVKALNALVGDLSHLAKAKSPKGGR